MVGLIFDKTPNPYRHILKRPWITPPVSEARFVRVFGEEQYEALMLASLPHKWPIPILGTVCYAVEGKLIPRIAGAGFTSLSDLINEATNGGKSQFVQFQRVGVTGVVAAHNTLWFEGSVPAAGAAGAALAGGTNCTRTTTGALGPQDNAAGGDTLHLVTGYVQATVASMTLLLYDRIWHGVPVITSGSGTPQTVTMTPARYAGTGAGGTSKGNFAFVEISSALPATAHGWDFQYIDDNGNTAETSPTVTGLSSGIAKRLDTAIGGSYIAPLNAGDVGISDLTQWTLRTANLASGALNFALGHPLCLLPCSTAANQMVVLDGINSQFNLLRIYDDACLALLEINKAATTATTYTGAFQLVSG